MEVIEVAGKLLGLAVADLGGGAESASEDEDTCWSREGSGASYEGGASDDDDGAGGKRKRMHASDNDDGDMFEPFDELDARPLKKAKHRLGHKVRRATESRVR